MAKAARKRTGGRSDPKVVRMSEENFVEAFRILSEGWEPPDNVAALKGLENGIPMVRIAWLILTSGPDQSRVIVDGMQGEGIQNSVECMRSSQNFFSQLGTVCELGLKRLVGFGAPDPDAAWEASDEGQKWLTERSEKVVARRWRPKVQP